MVIGVIRGGGIEAKVEYYVFNNNEDLKYGC